MELEDIVLKALGAVLLAAGTLIGTIMRGQAKKIESLDERVREVEQNHVNEKKVRIMIEDVVHPLKESNDEIKRDVKEILHVIINKKLED